MNIHVRRYRDTFIGMKAYKLEFPEDFPANSDEAEQMNEIETVLAEIEQYGGEQASGFGNVRFAYNSKGIARENLRELLEDIETAAQTSAYKITGIDLVFRVPHNLSDAQMLALARSFAEQAIQYRDVLGRRLGTDFIDRLQEALNAFEESLTPPEAASGAKVEATAKLGEAVRRGMTARRILKGIMKLKFKNNPSRKRAWDSASHIEREDNPDPKPPTT